jgi:tRNA-Thr(GGU) m(6)t(6)A37 methyltransferase TsaA
VTGVLPMSPDLPAGLVEIGRMHTPWGPGNCPRNPAEARARGGGAAAEIAPSFREGLEGLRSGQAVILLCWFHGARRDRLRLHPSHLAGPSGVFSLRTPMRPNPIGLIVARVLSMDAAEGRLDLDAAECWDGTPILDLRPWRAGADQPAPALPARAPSIGG